MKTKIRELRKARKLSQEELTDAVARYGDRALKKRLNIYEHGDRLLKECL